MSVISVSHLSKFYQIHKKEPGFISSLKSLFVRKYEVVRAVCNISFQIGEGECVGFIGPNGAGKTTTLKCLSGLLYPNEGEIEVLGFTPYQRKSDFLKQIALVMGQKNQLWWDLPAIESIVLNKEIYQIPDGEFNTALAKLAKLLEVSHLLRVQVRKLSLGERMKMELIAALIHTPRVLFLDEPTIGLDVVMQKKMREFIQEYNRVFGSTIILTSHYMGDVEELCERVIIINFGRIIYDGKLSKIVQKYAPYKILRIVFQEYVDLKALSRLGEIKELNLPHVVLAVSRGKSNLVASDILQNFPVLDLNIEEPEIEDVIGEIFNNEKILSSH